MTYKDYFSHSSETYAKYRPHYPSSLAQYLADLSPDKDKAWDAGCGSGQFSILLSEHFTEVLATDASAEQLRKAIPRPNLQYATAPAEKSSLAAHSVSLVTVAQAAHWFDLPAFYNEVQRVLAPHGVLALISYGNCGVSPEVDKAILHIYENILGDYWPPERRHVEDGYKNIPFPFKEVALKSFAMKEIWEAEQFIGYIKSWSAFNLYLQKNSPSALNSAFQALERAWGHNQRIVEWPLSLKIGRI